MELLGRSAHRGEFKNPCVSLDLTSLSGNVFLGRQGFAFSQCGAGQQSHNVPVVLEEMGAALNKHESMKSYGMEGGKKFWPLQLDGR